MSLKSKIALEKFLEVIKNADATFLDPDKNLDEQGHVDGYSHLFHLMRTSIDFMLFNDPLKPTLMLLSTEHHKILGDNVDAVYYNRISNVIKRRYNLKALDFTKTKEILPYVEEMFEVFSASYSRLSTFVPISDSQISYFKKKYISFINPEYIKFVMDENNKLVAFAIVMPSFSTALQKARGRLFPLGMLRLLKARKHAKDVTFYLIGVHPDYQNKGVTAIIFDQYTKTFSKKGIVNCIRTPELEENESIKKIWADFNPVTHKRRRTYRKNVE